MASKEVTFQLPKLHPAQMLVYNDDHRFRVVMASRRWGKNYLAAIEELRALFANGKVWHVVPDYPTAKAHWRLMEQLTRNIPGIIKNQTELTIELPAYSSGYFQIRSAGSGLRGDGLNFIGIDECIKIKDFEEVFQGDLRPTVSTTEGKMLLISSAMEYDYFYDLYILGQKGTNSEWKSFKFTAYDTPYISAKEIESARAGMTVSRFAREFLSEPQALGAVFYLDDQNKNAKKQNEAHEDHSYVVGADIGGSIDNTAYAVTDVTSQELVYMDAFLNPSYSAQIERLKDISVRFRPKVILVESNNAGAAFIQDCHAAGIPNIRSITTSNASKAAQVESLILDFEQHRYAIINDDELIREMNLYESSKTPTGLIKYEAKKGHDDRTMALLLSHEAGKTNNSPGVIQLPGNLWGGPSGTAPDSRNSPSRDSGRNGLWDSRNTDDRRRKGLWGR